MPVLLYREIINYSISMKIFIFSIIFAAICRYIQCHDYLYFSSAADFDTLILFLCRIYSSVSALLFIHIGHATAVSRHFAGHIFGQLTYYCFTSCTPPRRLAIFTYRHTAISAPIHARHNMSLADI